MTEAGTVRRRAPDLDEGPFPDGDGWGWVYRMVDRFAPQGAILRRGLCGYFSPTSLERWRRGLIFRIALVPLFGRIIPTGGILIRRWTGARMAPYTLASTSVGGARAFYYRACVFEALHLPFLTAMVALAITRLLEGRADLALENTLLNAAMNLYPILHHRRTRLRIVRLLERRARRSSD